MFIAKMGEEIIFARNTLEELMEVLNNQNYAIVEETEIDYQYYDGAFRTPEEVEALEEIRVNNLTMTPLDFIGVLQSLGLTLEQINAFLESNLNIKMQLTYCNSVYCGVVKSFLPITIEGITITPEMVESAFIAKNGG